MEVNLTEDQVIRLRMLVNHTASLKKLLIEELQAEGDPMQLQSVPALEMDVERLLKLRKILTDAFEQLEFDEVVEM